jgi:hypothetical protein
MSLERIQRAFLAHVVRGDDAIVAAVGARGRGGLAVHAHAYRANLVACLKDSYEKTLAWLGEDDFETAAREHITQHPPRGWTLNDYGEAFPRTLAGLYPADPEVEELAWLDWALRRAFDGPDANPPEPKAFGDIDWERAVLILSPTLATRQVSTNVAVLWNAMAEGTTPPPVEPLETPRTLAVWRRAFSPMFRGLEVRERAALDLARAGAGFGAICAWLAADHPDDEAAAAAEAGALLAAWLDDQIVVGVADALPDRQAP